MIVILQSGEVKYLDNCTIEEALQVLSDNSGRVFYFDAEDDCFNELYSFVTAADAFRKLSNSPKVFASLKKSTIEDKDEPA